MSVCSALCDVWSLGSVVAKGSRKPLTEDDLPEPSPIFALGAIEGTPAKIDARAAALRAADPDLKTPLVLKFVLAERRPLVVVACILGGCHGLINSCGRFIVLRLAIDAVLDEKSYQTRLIIGCLLVGIIRGESPHRATLAPAVHLSLLLSLPPRICLRRARLQVLGSHT